MASSTDEQADQDIAVARTLGFLLLREKKWVHRRNERFRFLDAETVRRQMSVDFTLPRHAKATQQGVWDLDSLVPLTMLFKTPLTRLSVWDETGKALPVLTTRENGELVGAMLAGFARSLATSTSAGSWEAPPEFLDALRLVASLPAAPARLLLECLPLAPQAQYDLIRQKSMWPDQRVVEALDPLSAHHERIQGVLSHEAFTNLAAEVAEQFVLFTRVEEPSPARRVLKFAYDEPLSFQGGGRPGLQRMLESVSYRTTDFDFETVAPGRSESHHVELEVPPGLDIVEAKIRVTNADGRVSTCSSGPPPEVVHLHVPPASRAAQGRVTVRVRAERGDILRTGPLLAWLIFGLLLWGRSRLVDIETDASTALVLAVPTILAILIVRPGEHALTSRILRGVRLLVVVAALAAAAAAAVIAFGYAGDERRFLWSLATWTSFGCAVLLLYSAFLPVVFATGANPAGRSRAGGTVDEQ